MNADMFSVDLLTPYCSPLDQQLYLLFYMQNYHKTIIMDIYVKMEQIPGNKNGNDEVENCFCLGNMHSHIP